MLLAASGMHWLTLCIQDAYLLLSTHLTTAPAHSQQSCAVQADRSSSRWQGQEHVGQAHGSHNASDRAGAAQHSSGA